MGGFTPDWGAGCWWGYDGVQRAYVETKAILRHPGWIGVKMDEHWAPTMVPLCHPCSPNMATGGQELSERGTSPLSTCFWSLLQEKMLRKGNAAMAPLIGVMDPLGH